MAMGWRLKYCGHWVLWARWAHGWLLLAVLSAGGWDLSAPLMLLRGSAWSRPWLCVPSPVSLCQVTSLALSPSVIF